MPNNLTAVELRSINTRYHDSAAVQYDEKWGIDFGETGQKQVLGKLRKVFPERLPRFRTGLEIGAGTGYFTLNLLQAGILEKAVCTDISPGMLEVLVSTAERLGLAVETVTSDGEQLPFEDDAFDFVFGHAILHHIPDIDRAFAEFARVLRPGGSFWFAGEPSQQGDRLAVLPKRGAQLLAPVWRQLFRARKAPESDPQEKSNSELEQFVDIHTFTPRELERIATQAGFSNLRIHGEELLANLFGWTNRTLEWSANQADIPDLWRKYAYHGYLTLQKVDRRFLEPYLPATCFYNLIVAGDLEAHCNVV